MGLAGARLADKGDILLLADELTGSHLVDVLAVDARLGSEVEFLNAFLGWEMSFLHPPVIAIGSAVANLVSQ